MNETLHKHHRKRRSQGGGDDPSNILLLPTQLHEWVHQNPADAYELGWLVHSYDDPEEVSVVIPKSILVEAPKKERAKRDSAPRKRRVWSVRAPADSEDGVQILEDLTQQARERLAPIMGWKPDVPAYYVTHAVFTDWLNSTDEV